MCFNVSDTPLNKARQAYGRQSLYKVGLQASPTHFHFMGDKATLTWSLRQNS